MTSDRSSPTVVRPRAVRGRNRKETSMTGSPKHSPGDRRGRLLMAVPVAALVAWVALLAVQADASSAAWTTERYYAQEGWHSFTDIGAKDGGGPTDLYASRQSLRSASGEHMGVVNGYGVNLKAPYVYFHYTGSLGASTLTLEG